VVGCLSPSICCDRARVAVLWPLGIHSASGFAALPYSCTTANGSAVTRLIPVPEEKCALARLPPRFLRAVASPEIRASHLCPASRLPRARAPTGVDANTSALRRESMRLAIVARRARTSSEAEADSASTETTAFSVGAGVSISGSLLDLRSFRAGARSEPHPAARSRSTSAAARYASRAPDPGPNPRCRLRAPRRAATTSRLAVASEGRAMRATSLGPATDKRDRHWVRRARPALHGERSRPPLVHAPPDRMAWSGRPVGDPEMHPLLSGAPPEV
jgi:hypothetical protein